MLPPGLVPRGEGNHRHRGLGMCSGHDLRSDGFAYGAHVRRRRDPSVVRSARIGTYDDARRLAHRRVPRAVFDYVDGGADGEETLRANRDAFAAVRFVPRQGVARGPADLTTTVLGTPVAFPVLLSPVGYTRLVHPDGDPAGARAAGAAGTNPPPRSIARPPNQGGAPAPPRPAR